MLLNFRPYGRKIGNYYAWFPSVRTENNTNLYSVSTKKRPPPKYNSVVFEILGKHHWNFYNRIWHICVHCVQKFVEIQRKYHILLHVFSNSSKTQVSVTTQTHAHSQLSPMNQCDYSPVVVTSTLSVVISSTLALWIWKKLLIGFREKWYDGQCVSLSLIHIWRCRRSTLCRSRWSPYH